MNLHSLSQFLACSRIKDDLLDRLIKDGLELGLLEKEDLP